MGKGGGSGMHISLSSLHIHHCPSLTTLVVGRLANPHDCSVMLEVRVQPHHSPIPQPCVDKPYKTREAETTHDRVNSSLSPSSLPRSSLTNASGPRRSPGKRYWACFRCVLMARGPSRVRMLSLHSLRWGKYLLYKQRLSTVRGCCGTRA